MRTIRAVLITLLAIACSTAGSAQPTADTVLLGGKIVTVDDRFTIVEALAVKDGRVIAVGSTTEIEKFKGAATQVLDLGGRTVIPGLIDNHAHFMRAAEYWHREVRLDGITSHSEALGLIRVARSR
jgi:predicted amidohydrolase YtcJ